MRNTAGFLVGVLIITLVAVAPEVMAADAEGNADSNDIYLLIVGAVCCLSFYLGLNAGLQR